MAGRTTLIFAHRLSSVIGADRILVLDEGKIVETGKHSELMDSRGHYFTLMSAQLSGAAVSQPPTRPQQTAVTSLIPTVKSASLQTMK